jgi:MFS family permease
MTPDLIAVPAVAGTLGALATAILGRLTLTSGQKRLIAILAAVALCGIGLFATSAPATWEAIATSLASAIGVCQAVFAALKPTGLLDWISGEDPKPRRAVEDEAVA